MQKSGHHDEIERLEHSFWQSMVDRKPSVATGMITEPALMVSSHGPMTFDRAEYTKMANNEQHRLLDYSLSDMDVLFPTDDVAIATYRAHQKMEMDGKPLEFDSIDSSTWVKLDGAWKCAAHTESESKAPTKQ
jgi:ketosteroid isomerase-like protein